MLSAEILFSIAIFSATFGIVSLASRQIGVFLSRYGLPYITGYLFVGIAVGPFALAVLPAESTDALRYVDELSLAVIAFVAGSELYLKEIRSRLRQILINTTGVVIAAFAFISIAIYLLSNFIPFMSGLDASSRIAIALLGATILLALSPPSTIAVIQEMRAKGTFTKTTLSMTVVMDVIIIVLFAISTAIADLLLTNAELNPTFVVFLAIDLAGAVFSGYVVGRLLELVLALRIAKPLKISLILIAGLAVFVTSFWVDELKIGIHLEPLLEAMIAGFYVTNFTRYRDEFEEILHDVSPVIYVVFFTLTGIALRIDVLIASGLIAAILFGVRALAIFVGSYIGGTLAGEIPRHRNLLWLGLIAQAGIALGLAREVSVEFHEFDFLGNEFATLIISVVVINQILGPLFFKYALRRVGESHEPETAVPDDVRDVLILGVAGQALALARQLRSHDWKVTLVDTNSTNLERLPEEDVAQFHIEEITPETLGKFINKATDAVVAMLDDDRNNLVACEIAYEKFGITRLVVRLNDLTLSDQFTAIGATIVDPASAMVNLLDQSVRTPQAAALTMQNDPTYELVQITITDDEIDNVLCRDLRLPDDVLVVEISRNGETIVPRGSTAIKKGDDIILVGKPESLNEVTLKFGF